MGIIENTKEEDGTITFGQPDFAPVWHPTNRMRWVLRQISPQHAPEKILQQLWWANNGDQEWRDIEILEED